MCCSTDACDKEVGSCRACGTGVPQNARGKPKTFCSKKCRDEWLRRERGCLSCGGPVQPLNVFCSSECRGRKRADKAAERARRSDAARCLNCGVDITRRPATPGRNRKYCSGACGDAWLRKQAAATLTGSCERCCAAIAKGKSYCSDECRWPNRKGARENCRECGKEFLKPKYSSTFCSTECSSRRSEKHMDRMRLLRRLARPPKVLSCLCCAKPFSPHPGGGRVGKYCSRNCAFEARRLRLPVTRFTKRHGTPIENQLAAWFHAWGNDADDVVAGKRQRSGHKYRCQKFGVPYEKFSLKGILKRDGWECQWCGCELLRKLTEDESGKTDPRSPCVDHIVPLSLGPPCPGHVPSNVQASCYRCNQKKGSLMPDSFAARLANKLP